MFFYVKETLHVPTAYSLGVIIVLPLQSLEFDFAFVDIGQARTEQLTKHNIIPIRNSDAPWVSVKVVRYVQRHHVDVDVGQW